MSYFASAFKLVYIDMVWFMNGASAISVATERREAVMTVICDVNGGTPQYSKDLIMNEVKLRYCGRLEESTSAPELRFTNVRAWRFLRAYIPVGRHIVLTATVYVMVTTMLDHPAQHATYQDKIR